MEMQLDVQKLKELRESKAWSQSHLAEVAGISLRTIQRIEKSGIASPESAKSICASYDIKIVDIYISGHLKVEVAPTLSNVVRFKVENMDKKAILISFLLAFVIAFVLTY
jgi:DNA-binding XRE family transcriptional regulator